MFLIFIQLKFIQHFLYRNENHLPVKCKSNRQTWTYRDSEARAVVALVLALVPLEMFLIDFKGAHCLEIL